MLILKKKNYQLSRQKGFCKTKGSGAHVRDLSYFAVKGVPEINDVLKIGMKNRSVGATNMNAVSSRSHSLF